MFKTLVLGVVLCFMCYNVLGFIHSIPMSVKLVNENKTLAKMSLLALNVPVSKVEKYSRDIDTASRATNQDPILLATIIKTESNFDQKAVSNKGYKGLMQTPSATLIYSDVDILHGARILEAKRHLTNDNLLEALTMYKGGNNRLARKYANETYRLYFKVKSQVVLKRGEAISG